MCVPISQSHTLLATTVLILAPLPGNILYVYAFQSALSWSHLAMGQDPFQAFL